MNKEISQLLCDAMRCRMEDGEVSTENWKDSKGSALAPDCSWNTTTESMIAVYNAGPCWGIELNILKLAKMGIHFNDIFYMYYHINYVNYTDYDLHGIL